MSLFAALPPTGTALDRRDFLLGATASAVMPNAAAFAQAPPSQNSAAATLDALLEEFLKARLARSPEDATNLGLDSGDNVALKSRLDNRSLAAIAQDRRDVADRLRRLRTINRNDVAGQAAVNYDVVAYWLETEDNANKQLDYISSRPYVLDQREGAYFEVPDFLDTKHGIETKDDADAYLARLDAFPAAIDQETERFRNDSALGVVPPDFILDTTLEQLNDLARQPPAQNTLVTSLLRRTQEKGIPGNYEEMALGILRERIVPALDRQAALLSTTKSRATHDAGIWKLRNGEAAYAALLKLQTTTSKSADEIHQLGIDTGNKISVELDLLLRAEGFADGTVGERLRALSQEPKYLYPDTKAGRDQLLADVNAKVDAVRRKLPSWFKTLPKSDVQVVRVPAAIEAGASAAYYTPPSLDGKRAGICYFNLRRITDWPKWRPPSIMYHESIPGHHMQNALALESLNLPRFTKVLWFAGYGEGWALYAEQLADEMGLYEADRVGRIGYLQAALLRAGRLVADTGIHAKRWSRERAINYFAELMGFSTGNAAAEIDRYCVSPGQACSYMVGKNAWLEQRARAKDALDARFDIGAFHDATLLAGPAPLDVLSGVVDDFIRKNKP